MHFKGILFDLGNTLLHFEGDGPAMTAKADLALTESLLAAGLPLEKARFIREFRSRISAYYMERDVDLVEHTTHHILCQLLGDYGLGETPDAVLEEALEQMYHVSQAHWIPETDAQPTLDTLQKAGLRMGIVSNAADDSDVQQLVDKAGIRPYFDFILSSAACGYRKPDPTIFNIALEHWDFAPAEIAMVGDTLYADILGAQQSGLYGIWITRRAGRPANLADRDEILPDAVIGTLAELPTLLR